MLMGGSLPLFYLGGQACNLNPNVLLQLPRRCCRRWCQPHWLQAKCLLRLAANLVLPVLALVQLRAVQLLLVLEARGPVERQAARRVLVVQLALRRERRRPQVPLGLFRPQLVLQVQQSLEPELLGLWLLLLWRP